MTITIAPAAIKADDTIIAIMGNPVRPVKVTRVIAPGHVHVEDEQAAAAGITPDRYIRTTVTVERPAPAKLTWKRAERGRQVSECGRYAVENDGYSRGYFTDPRDMEYGRITGPNDGRIMGDGGEWAAVVVATNENIDWFPTMREAKAAAQRHTDSR